MALSREHLREDMEIRLFELAQEKKKLEKRIQSSPKGKLFTSRSNAIIEQILL